MKDVYIHYGSTYFRPEAFGKGVVTMKKPMVWAKMIYVCDDCGSQFEIFIENTLERHNGDKHKPVPFGIQCPNCKNFHCYDRSFLIELPEERPVKTGELYFADKKKYDCGVVRIYGN